MGVPSYFAYLIRNHKEMILKLANFKKQINNLYFDSNSIIYDALRFLSKDYSKYKNDDDFEKDLIDMVCVNLENYINEIKPNKKVLIAFDGVAPVAKLEQQRTRRHKSMLEKKVMNHICGEKKEWNKTAITPGTNFMDKLNTTVENYFKGKEKKYRLNKFIFTGSNEPGEGEHKLFGYIRDHECHINEVTVVYGLDADLIMLCLNHLRISKHIYLYRETPEFVKSIDNSINPDESYLLDIPYLAQRIIMEMNGNKKPSSATDTNKLYDYIFLCFFLGNDFLPHFPSVNIRTNGIDLMLGAYKAVIGKSNQNLTDGKTINWRNVRKLVKFLADNEYDNLMNEYKIRCKWERRNFPCGTDEEKIKKYLHIPIKNREIEKYINPYDTFWQKRYYESLFNTEESFDFKKEVSINYMEGLEWVMNYYTKDCIDWRWHYKYNYPPLFKDLLKFIPSFDTVMVAPNNHTNVSPSVQLSYVLPIESLHLIKNNIGEKLLEERSEYYAKHYGIKWAFCKFMWESHLELPHIDLEDLEEFVESI
jgi:5'-3' exonuclease